MQWREIYRPGTRDSYIVWNGQKTNGNYICLLRFKTLYSKLKRTHSKKRFQTPGDSKENRVWRAVAAEPARLTAHHFDACCPGCQLPAPKKGHPHEQKKARWFHLGFSCLSKNCAYPTGYIIITFLVNLPFWDLPMFRQTRPFWSRSGLKGFQFLLKLLDFPLNLCKLLMLMAPLKPL